MVCVHGDDGHTGVSSRIERRGPLPRFRLYTSPAHYQRVLRDLALGRVDRGDDRPMLEQAIARWTGVPFAVCMPQARVGIHLVIRSLIKPGQSVVLSPYTIHEVVNMVLCAGGIPVFADIDSRTCNLDPARAEELLDARTGAVLVTHLHGLAMDLDGLASACRLKGIPLVEDAAQAFGARVGGRSVGSFGDAGIFSFGMYKNVTSFLGGAAVTRHEWLGRRLADDMAAFRLQPWGSLLRTVASAALTDLATYPPLFRRFTFPLFRFGYLHEVELLNKRVRVEDCPRIKRQMPEHYLRQMRPTQARVLLQRLEQVDRHTERRIAFAHRYHAGLSDLSELILPPLRDDGSHTYTYFPIQFEDRHRLVRHLMRSGCDLAVQHLRNCADLECFREYHRECPNARATAHRTILLPTYPRYGQEDVERNIGAIRAFFGRSGGSG